METTIKSQTESISLNTLKTNEQIQASVDFWKKMESNRFGITPLILLVMSIIGGIAAASGIMDSWVELAAVAFPSTICLALILSVSPMRAIVIGSIIAVTIDLFVIAF
jgi:hypothetical protein